MTIAASYPAIRPSLLLDFANTQELDPRITFTRATTATYYDGVTTAMAEQNLSPYSEQFDNAIWVKTNSTITANSTTAPDGTATADSFVVTASGALTSITSSSSFNVGVSGQPLTISIYAKANTATVIQLSASIVILPASYANFDLSSGTVGNIGGTGLTASIVSVGSGWYRCSITIASASGSAGYVVAIVDSTTSARQSVYTGSAGNDLYIWGIQAEQRASVTAYTATTTAPVTNYIPVLKTAAANVARFDHNPTTNESLGLLIEGSRTNGFLYSQDFTNAYWNYSNAVTITANVTVAPDGTTTGNLIVPNAGTVNARTGRNSAGTGGVNRTYSFYVKENGIQYITINTSNTNSYGTCFDIVNGTKIDPTSGVVGTPSITNAGNGWWRVTHTTATGTVPTIIPGTTFVRKGTADTDTFNGTDGFYIWGAQWEDTAIFATSYIPTVASQVTRAADYFSMTGTNFSSWYREDASSFYAEITSGGNSNTQYALGRSSPILATTITYSNTSPYSNNILASATNRSLAWQTQGTGTDTIGASNSYPTNVSTKVAVAYSFGQGDTVAAAGVATQSGTPRTRLQQATGFYLAQNYEAVRDQLWVKKVSYYPARITNAQLQALTS